MWFSWEQQSQESRCGNESNEREDRGWGKRLEDWPSRMVIRYPAIMAIILYFEGVD